MIFQNAYNVLGPDFVHVRGKPLNCKPWRVTTDYASVPHEFFMQNVFLTLMPDAMFIHWLTFSVTYCKDHGLLTLDSHLLALQN